MTVSIPLSKGYTAIVDDADADLAAFKWHATSDKWPYAARRVRINGKRQYVFMHTIILERVLGRSLEEDERCDHIRHPHYDNRRANLRPASCKQNAGNRARSSKSTSGWKGVSLIKGGCIAQIMSDGRNLHLGTFNTPEEAAIAYNHAAKRVFGEFAFYNEIPEWESIHPQRRSRKQNKATKAA